MLMVPFCTLLTLFTLLLSLITQWLGTWSATRKSSMVTQTSQCLTNTMIMCEIADQCGQMDLPASHLDRLLLRPCRITFWLPWDDVKNLLCGQDLQKDITSPHHTASNVRTLNRSLHEFYSSVSTEPFLL